LAGLATIVKFMPECDFASVRNVVIIVYDGMSTFEFGIAVEVFGLDRPEMGPNWYRMTTAAAQSGRLRTAGGLTAVADHGLDDLISADTIVVPGWREIGTVPPEPLLAALRAAADRGTRIVSLCTGAFVLAAAGLLDNKLATTHWRHVDAFSAAFPAVRVDPDVLYVDQESVMTSAGSAAGIDLLLHIVRKDFGPEAANSVARRMVVQPHRNGGQAQFIERPVQHYPNGKLASLLGTMRERLDTPMTISSLAQQAAMSERTFLRRFKEMTGMTPANWLMSVRLECAKQLLETGQNSIEDVAITSGFGSAATLRMHFRAIVGISPREYRVRFSHHKDMHIVSEQNYPT
jgi:AraC family transcriptional regulator, transcriptional activator FtrA